MPGSTIDEQYASVAAEGDRFIRGSGTSQAAAVVSGAAALLLQQRPCATPDQIKELLRQAGEKLRDETDVEQGKGELRLSRILRSGTPGPKPPPFAWSTGAGAIEGARGTTHLVDAGVELRGELDIFGAPLASASLAAGAQRRQRLARRRLVRARAARRLVDDDDLGRPRLGGSRLVGPRLVRPRAGRAAAGPGAAGPAGAGRPARGATPRFPPSWTSAPLVERRAGA